MEGDVRPLNIHCYPMMLERREKLRSTYPGKNSQYYVILGRGVEWEVRGSRESCRLRELGVRGELGVTGELGVMEELGG